MRPDPPRGKPCNGLVVLCAASLLATVLGSVHAFSIFLTPLEVRFEASRGLVSLTYSMALVTLTLAVLWGHRIYARWSSGRFVLAICLLAALGAAVAGFAPTLPVVWLGYSVMFGCANGLGYGFGLQLAAQANPGREGLAMGIVTAAYASGAALSPALFDMALSAGGFRIAMLGLVVVLLVVGVICAGLMQAAQARFVARDTKAPPLKVPQRTFVLLWLGYGAGVAAGLMTIGHAAGIASALSYEGAAWVAPVVIAISNLVGSLVAGKLADRPSQYGLLIGLPLLSAVSVISLVVFGGPGLVMVFLGIIGFTYGGIIAAYPATIAKMFDILDAPRVYGRVFTAWGSAGLLGPWLAGSLFDWTGSYQMALMVAGVLAVVSVLAVRALLGREAA